MFFEQALLELKPKAEWSIKGETCYENLTWFDKKQSKPTETEINDKIAEFQADYDSKEYQRKRLAEYPDLQECIHAILDDDLTALQAKRKLVKEKYPKPK